MLAAAWLAFGGTVGTDLDLTVASVLCLVFLALPIIMYRTTCNRLRKAPLAPKHFLSSRVEVATGPLSGGEARASGDYERAIADLSKAITLNPKGAEGYVRRGIAYEKEGDHKDAIADFSTVIRLKPGYATAYTMRGGAYEVAGDKGKAIADFRAALAIDPSLDTVKSAIRRLGGIVLMGHAAL